MIYRLYIAGFGVTEPNAATTVGVNPQISFLFDPANTDYANFKKEVLAGAELQDADGNTMTTEEANAFIGTLP